MGFLTHGFLMIFALNKPTPRASNSRVPIRSFDGPEIAPKMAAVWRIKTPATQCKLPANQQRSTEPEVGKLRWYYKSPRIYWNLLCFFDHSNSWSISPVLLNFCILSQSSKSHKWFFTGSTGAFPRFLPLRTTRSTSQWEILVGTLWVSSLGRAGNIFGGKIFQWPCEETKILSQDATPHLPCTSKTHETGCPYILEGTARCQCSNLQAKTPKLTTVAWILS